MEQQRQKNTSALFFVILAAAGFFYFLYPVFMNLSMSFVEFRLAGMGEFIGLKNYADISQSESFWRVFANTLGFLFPFKIALIILVTAAASYILMGTKKLFRTILITAAGLFLFISSPMLISILYNSFYSPQWGFLSSFLQGLGQQPVYYLAQPEYATEIAGNADFLTTLAFFLPLGMILFHASAQGTRIAVPGETPILRQIGARSWRLMLAVIAGIAGFSLANPETFFLLQNPITYKTTDVLQTLSFRRGIIEAN
ncbi:MAG: sugar ABC transporter permease, partial [Spirochaetaceae bacterium]